LDHRRDPLQPLGDPIALRAIGSTDRQRCALEAPNPNLQAPKKRQSPNTNECCLRGIGYWSLRFLWVLVLGVWGFIAMDEPRYVFHAFGPSHLTVIFLTIALPFFLAFTVHRTKSRFLERSICFAISALLLINYVAYLIVGRQFGVTEWYRALPMQLCDWAMIVIMIALWTGNRRALEIAYFWGIGGTLQALITPNLRFGFPDLRFISFFVAHSGIIIGIVFLMLIYGFRPAPSGILRTFLWTEVYFVVAFTTDLLTGMNYGFLLHKPEAASLLSFLSDWRALYLLEFHLLAFAFFTLLYTPFAIVDLVRGKSLRNPG
jgi:hypothetical integral membrane protein (TIGR02206 family)